MTINEEDNNFISLDSNNNLGHNENLSSKSFYPLKMPSKSKYNEMKEIMIN